MSCESCNKSFQELNEIDSEDEDSPEDLTKKIVQNYKLLAKKYSEGKSSQKEANFLAHRFLSQTLGQSARVQQDPHEDFTKILNFLEERGALTTKKKEELFELVWHMKDYTAPSILYFGGV